MSLQPHPIDPVPEETARVAQAAFPRGHVYLRLRDELGSIYSDELFAPVFPSRGQPAFSPWRLALVLVMQFAEGLSDRQAADAVRGRIDWKYALGLELTDPGFDASVLTEFRARLVAGSLEYQLLDVLLARCRAAGLLKARGRARTDSTHVLAAIRALNRLECVGETMRQALNALAVTAPDWLREQLQPEWTARYGPRFDDYRLPPTPTEREALAETIGRDGTALLTALWQPAAPPWLRHLPAVEVLRRVWVQQYYWHQEVLRWRPVADLPPAAQMINSPYDPEARYSCKRSTTWTGYKVHLTETYDPDAPHLITHVETTPATTPDWHMLPPIHQALAAKGQLPAEHTVDAGYVDSEVVVTSATAHEVRVVGPVPTDHSWQAREGKGLASAQFVVNWEAEQVTCPGGYQSVKWSPTHDQHGNAIINIRFARQDCAGCGLRADCTRSAQGPRELSIRPQAQHIALQEARAYQQTAEFAAEYAGRAGVEGTVSQGVRVCDVRRARYVGLAKTRLQHILTAAALNVVRLGAWWAALLPDREVDKMPEPPHAKTRITPFLALVRQAA